MTGEPTREVLLPSSLCNAAEERFKSEFGSLEQLLSFVLTQLLREDSQALDLREQGLIDARLKDLGYL